MKTLIFNGSPRKNGDTMALVREMQRHLEGQVDMVSSYHDDVHPCLDCRFCWKQEGCTIDDDLQRVLESMDSYDNIVIASPIYFSELTGSLLSMFSRLQQFFCARRFRGVTTKPARKHGALVLAAAADTSPDRAVATAKILLGQMNAPSIGMALTGDTDHLPGEEDEAALQQAKELALQFNRLHREKA